MKQGELFFNTINLTGADLAESRAKNGTQDARMLELFRKYRRMTPVEALRAYNGLYDEIPLTSARRSITVLTGLKMLRKLPDMKMGLYGKPNFVWEII